MQYLAFIEQDGAAWGGFIPELHATATGKNRQQVIDRLSEGATFTFVALTEEGKPIPQPVYQSAQDLSAEERQDVEGMEPTFITPAGISATSVAIGQAIERSGLNRSEVARRMGTSPAAITRITSMFYFDHSLSTLRQLAGVLNLPLSRFSGLKDLAPEDFLSSNDGGVDMPGEITMRWTPELAELKVPALVRWEGILFWLDTQGREVEFRGLRMLVFEGSMVDDRGYVQSILNSA
jgi:transcriptional regulator with XRE-family HTH domain/predicted RNase H-like HicB family nuclease